MQIINSYSEQATIRKIQRFRLYHLSRPNLRQWRQTRHGKQYSLDGTDRWILNNVSSTELTMVDCAGWYFEQFGKKTVCLESDDIAKQYWPVCYVEPDIFTHRPTYISQTNTVVFKYPWFLKYIKLDEFLKFLDTWVQTETVLNFYPRYIQHNHLKYKLLNLVNHMTQLKIQEINPCLWIIRP